MHDLYVAEFYRSGATFAANGLIFIQYTAPEKAV